MSRERESYLVEVVLIQHQDGQTIPEEQWSLEDVCSYLGVPAGMIKTIKANERESHEMYREFIKTNFPFRISVNKLPVELAERCAECELLQDTTLPFRCELFDSAIIEDMAEKHCKDSDTY
ncbi:hypothetical protein [Paenibacillus pseudetheri]|uniref:Uncharacterized protein n=1 Tax=Paenibacillus pseudetheri TaxID=2897682 RepID=A0ABM9B766_9BACL|nr:hypothetical protein [Paenibacillus pseudetheri]CAH1054000.1 hypothetical protein PAECIP111894_00145 [Paenibacillus pseudetheri]